MESTPLSTLDWAYLCKSEAAQVRNSLLFSGFTLNHATVWYPAAPSCCIWAKVGTQNATAATMIHIFRWAIGRPLFRIPTLGAGGDTCVTSGPARRKPRGAVLRSCSRLGLDKEDILMVLRLLRK